MARLLVVSRSMALAMRLADAHEVAEHAVEEIDHLAPSPDVDVVVLDVGEPAAAIHALDRLRGQGNQTPVLIVSGYQPAWAGLVAVDLPDVVVVPLPITRAALLGGIAELSRAALHRPAAVIPPPAYGPPPTASDPPTTAALPQDGLRSAADRAAATTPPSLWGVAPTPTPRVLHAEPTPAAGDEPTTPAAERVVHLDRGDAPLIDVRDGVATADRTPTAGGVDQTAENGAPAPAPGPAAGSDGWHDLGWEALLAPSSGQAVAPTNGVTPSTVTAPEQSSSHPAETGEPTKPRQSFVAWSPPWVRRGGTRGGRQELETPGTASAPAASEPEVAGEDHLAREPAAVDEVPVDEVPADEVPLDEPADEVPLDEPADEVPVDEVPVDEPVEVPEVDKTAQVPVEEKAAAPVDPVPWHLTGSAWAPPGARTSSLGSDAALAARPGSSPSSVSVQHADRLSIEVRPAPAEPVVENAASRTLADPEDVTDDLVESATVTQALEGLAPTVRAPRPALKAPHFGEDPSGPPPDEPGNPLVSWPHDLHDLHNLDEDDEDDDSDTGPVREADPHEVPGTSAGDGPGDVSGTGQTAGSDGVAWPVLNGASAVSPTWVTRPPEVFPSSDAPSEDPDADSGVAQSGWAAQDFDWWRSPVPEPQTAGAPTPTALVLEAVPVPEVTLDPEPVEHVVIEVERAEPVVVAVATPASPTPVTDDVPTTVLPIITSAAAKPSEPAKPSEAEAPSEPEGSPAAEGDAGTDAVADSETAAFSPADAEPADPEPTDPEPTDPEPTDPEPADPEVDDASSEQDAVVGQSSLPKRPLRDPMFDRPPSSWNIRDDESEHLSTGAQTWTTEPVSPFESAAAAATTEADDHRSTAAELERLAAARIAQRRALLGRPEHTPGPSALSRRLGGRPFATSLGPGGTSPELIALGLHGDPDDTADQPTWEQAARPAPEPAPVAEPAGLVTQPAPRSWTAPRAWSPPGARSTPLQAGPAPTQAPSPAQGSAPASVNQVPPSRWRSDAGSTAGSPRQPAPSARDEMAQLVRALTDRAGSMFGVADTAQVLADEVVERADADAVAILVPDGVVWRVAGGVGLRPLERRLVMDASHWLVSEIAVDGRALLVEDTDIVRPKLAGAPLAAWRHLLAVPVPQVRAAVILARGHEAGAFTEHDLAAIIGPIRESAALLHTALATRQLARLLSPLRETESSG